MNKKLLTLLLGGVVGCHSSEKPVASPPASLLPATSAKADSLARGAAFMLADSLRRNAPLVLPPLGPGDTLSAAAQELLRTHNLAPLWASSTADHAGKSAMEGFYGPAHYRISFYYDEVRRDSLHPERFLVRGRNRYRKVITPFQGTIIVRNVLDAKLDVDNSYQPTDSVKTFVIRATYELREDPQTKGAGVYRGEALLDVYEDHHQRLHQADIWGTGYNPTGGGGVLFRGSWTDNRTQRQRSAAWANDLRSVSPASVLREQELGGRVGDVDPVLAKLGWNEFWENEEWWAAAPKPRFRL